MKEDSTVEMLKIQFNQVRKLLVVYLKKLLKLSIKVLKILILFPSTVLCEKAFSALLYNENKFQNRIENITSIIRLMLWL